MIHRPSTVSSLTLSLLIASTALLLWATAIRIAALTIATTASGDVDARWLVFDGDEPRIQFDRFQDATHSRTWTDLAGTPQAPPGPETRASMLAFSKPYSRSPADEANAQFRRIRKVATNYVGHESWYMVHDGGNPGGVWFECYSTLANRRITCLGTSGAANDVPSPADRFPGRIMDFVFAKRLTTLWGQSSLDINDHQRIHPFLFIADAENIHRLDVVNRTVSKVCSTPTDFMSIKATLQGEPSVDQIRGHDGEFDPADWYLMIRTQNSIIRMNAAGKNRLTISLPPDAQGKGVVTYWERLDGRPVLNISHSQQGPDFKDASGAFFDITKSGELINEQKYSWRDQINGLSATEQDVALGFTLPCPLLVAGTAVTSPLFPAAPTLQRLRFAIRLSLLSGLLAMWLCAKHQAVHDAPNRVVWMAFVFLFGVFGYLGYRFHRRWITADLKIQTEDEFIEPTMTGIEVFA